MTMNLNGKTAQGIPPIVPGCPMPTATRYDFEVALHRFTALLRRAKCSPFVLGKRSWYASAAKWGRVPEIGVSYLLILVVKGNQVGVTSLAMTRSKVTK